MNIHLIPTLLAVAFEGENPDPNAAGTNAAAGNEVKFTPEQQVHINALLAKEKSTMKGRLDALNKQVGDVPKLQSELARMRTELQTETEQREEKITLLSQRLETELPQAQNEAKAWKTRYADSTIKASLLSEFGSTAINPTQIIALFGSKAELVEIKDGENVNYEVRVQHQVKDAAGKLVTKRLPMNEFYKAVFDDPAHSNLFKGKGSSGTGSGTGGGTDTRSFDERVAANVAAQKQRK